jgi:hypothetical protein
MVAAFTFSSYLRAIAVGTQVAHPTAIVRLLTLQHRIFILIVNCSRPHLDLPRPFDSGDSS